MVLKHIQVDYHVYGWYCSREFNFELDAKNAKFNQSKMDAYFKI